MDVILFNGSPNEKGCTYTGLTIIKDQLEANGLTSEIVQVGREPVRGCVACMGCRKTGECVFNDDSVNAAAKKLREAEGLIIGSAVHFAGATGAAASFLDRLFFSIGRTSLKMKFGASIVSCRRGGATAAFDQLNKYFTISQMPIVSSCYWNQIHGHTPEEVMKDAEGIRTLKVLANNMAYLIKCKNAASIPPPEEPEFVMTNFIR
ncbi:MAG: flavodoxin family protein [Treponema sp.]|jgi:multimeric flavodoxin WrbA|nr:flavodoxin family protein [Treponema sp.]